RRIWKQLLIEWKMYADLVDLCEQFLTRLSAMTRHELWECDYYATHLSDVVHRNIAEKRHKADLVQGDDSAAYHNLYTIYLKKSLGALKKAAYFRSKQSFAKYIGMEEWAFNGHWRKLVAWGMIVEEDRRTFVHPLICTYLEQGWPIVAEPSVKTKEHKHEESSLVLHVKELYMGDQI